MVDALGVPMHGRTPFMDKNSAVYCPPSVQFGSTDNNATTASVYGGALNYVLDTASAGTPGGFGPTIESKPFYDCGFSAGILNAATAGANAGGITVGGVVPTSALGYALVAEAVSVPGVLTTAMSGKLAN